MPGKHDDSLRARHAISFVFDRCAKTASLENKSVAYVHDHDEAGGLFFPAVCSDLQ